MPRDRTLPGLAPAHSTFELRQEEDGYWRLRTWAGDVPGFRTRQDWTVYENLTLEEAEDVIAATLRAWAARGWC